LGLVSIYITKISTNTTHMASLSSEVASMSVADSSSPIGDTWEVVRGDEDYGRSLSVRTEISITSTLVRVIKKGQVFATVGEPTVGVNQQWG
jgi:hypothetical protein